MLQTQSGAPREHERQVPVAVAVALGHAAAKERHRGVEERPAIEILRLREPRQEVGELLGHEDVVLRELLHVVRIAAVVAEHMAKLPDADLGDRLFSQVDGGHAGDIGLEGEHQEVEDGPETVSRPVGEGDVAVHPCAVGV